MSFTAATNRCNKRILFFLALILLLSFIIIVRILDEREERTIGKLYNELDKYNCFFVDEKFWYDLVERTYDTSNYALDKLNVAVYKEYKWLPKELIKEYKVEVINFNCISIGKTTDGKYLKTYDYDVSSPFMELSFFDLKEGRKFEDDKNQVYVVRGNAKPGDILYYIDSQNVRYEFEVVGIMTYPFLPIGYVEEGLESAQVTQVQDETLLLNPNCEFLKKKELSGTVNMFFVKFDKSKEIDAKYFLSNYGKLKY